jgi:dTDP-4-dehydrorhamnose 3,5-epimerase
MIKGVLATPISIIKADGGNIFHSIKVNEPGYSSFGEAYFSEIYPNAIKGWKLHKIMTLNITVPIGKIRFVLYDDRNDSTGVFQELVISRKNYIRLTVPPNIWVAFQGLSNSNSLLLNVADIPHNPTESISKDLNQINFDWSK